MVMIQRWANFNPNEGNNPNSVNHNPDYGIMTILSISKSVITGLVFFPCLAESMIIGLRLILRGTKSRIIGLGFFLKILSVVFAHLW